MTLKDEFKEILISYRDSEIDTDDALSLIKSILDNQKTPTQLVEEKEKINRELKIITENNINLINENEDLKQKIYSCENKIKNLEQSKIQEKIIVKEVIKYVKKDKKEKATDEHFY